MEQPISSDLIRGHIDTIILHTLLSGDKSAQQITDSVELDSEKKYQLNQATLYSSLKRLEKLKYLTSYWYDYDKGRRKFFQITKSGKAFVNENLISWTFSRSIIDKLVGYEEPKTIPLSVISPTISAPKTVLEVSPEKSNIENLEKNIIPKKSDFNASVSTEEKIEVNYRNILNGLISYSNSNDVIRENIETTEAATELENVKKFNETIEVTDSNIEKSIGEIDYSDIVVKGEKDGVKVRVSSKDSAKQAGNLYSNKLSFSSILIIFALSMLEFLVINTKYSSYVNPVIRILSIILLCIFPIYFGIRFFLSPKKSINEIVGVDEIITSAIVVFNIIVIIVALCFVLNVDFSNISNVLSFIVMPIIICLNVILYFVARFFLAKQKRFYVIK